MESNWPSRWQYKAEHFTAVTAPSIEEKLNKLGQEGWQLVNVVTQYSAYIFIFKRRKND